jgi:flagellar biosynthetic protein FliR
MEALLQRLGVALNYQQELLISALMLTRSMVMVTQTPWLGGKNIPPEIKMGIGVMITIIVWPLARTTMTGAVPVTPIPFFFLMMKETLIGFVIGFMASSFDTLTVAGRVIDTVRGTSMAEVMVPLSGERATPVGDLFFQLMLVIFMAMGGHRVFLAAYAHSFEIIPLDKHLDYGGALWPMFDEVMRVTGEMLFIGVLISTPIIAATFITDLVFGILNRVAPQLNAYFLSMPVKAMAGIIMILIAMEPLIQRMMDYLVWSLGIVEQIIDMMVRAA